MKQYRYLVNVVKLQGEDQFREKEKRPKKSWIAEVWYLHLGTCLRFIPIWSNDRVPLKILRWSMQKQTEETRTLRQNWVPHSPHTWQCQMKTHQLWGRTPSLRSKTQPWLPKWHFDWLRSHIYQRLWSPSPSNISGAIQYGEPTTVYL